MSHQSSFPDRLRHAFATPNQGVLGLVEELLRLSWEQDFQLAWQAGHCQVDFLDGDRPAWLEVPLPRSVIRAALARIAILCNDRRPNSVSPYGGQGEVVVDADPTKTIRVTFVNAPEKLSLALASVVEENDHLPSSEVVRFVR
jgi:hypothetical protein